MGSPLPLLSQDKFQQTLRVGIEELSRQEETSEVSDLIHPDFEERCYAHYCELRLWNPRISLIGPGTAQEVIQRHYLEALAGLPWIVESVEGLKAERSKVEGLEVGRSKVEGLKEEQGVSEIDDPSSRATLVDLGSGGGFPAFVLAAARSDLEVFLVEPRQKKWNFLRAAARRSGLSYHCLDGKVGRLKAGHQVETTDLVTRLPAGLPESMDLVTSRALALSKDQFQLLHRHSPKARFFLWQGEYEPDLGEELRVLRSLRLAESRVRRVLEIIPREP